MLVFQIQNDFEKLYKKKLFNIEDTWSKIKGHLILKLQQCKGIKTLDDKAYVHLLPSLTSGKYIYKFTVKNQTINFISKDSFNPENPFISLIKNYNFTKSPLFTL